MKQNSMIMLIACIILAMLTLTTAITSKQHEKQKPIIDNWRVALDALRNDHPYFFSKQVNSDILKEFDDYLLQMRKLGVNVDAPDSWNSLFQFRDEKKVRWDLERESNTATTRADRFSPFKVPNQIDQRLEDSRINPHNPHNPHAKGQDEPVIISDDIALQIFQNIHTKPSTNSVRFASLQTDGEDTTPTTPCEEGDENCTPDDGTEEPEEPEPEVPVDDIPAATPQHLIPSVQGLESNRGTGVLAATTQSWCRAVLRDDYQVYPQKMLVDVTTVEVRFQDLECERHIERDDLVRILPITASLISDDKLRYTFAKLGCAWFYRPLSSPSKLPCVSQCTAIRDFIRDLDRTTASPSQLKDRAVLQTIAWPILLFAGQCEYTPFYDGSNDPEKCIHPDDYDNTFKTFEEAQLGRPTCQPYPQSGGLCSGLLTNSYVDPGNKAVSNLIEQSTPLLRSLFALAPAHGEDQCVKALAQQVCSRYTMSCTEVPITMGDQEGGIYAVKYALPVLPHQSVCQNYQKHCTSFIQQLSQMSGSVSSAQFQGAIALLDPACDGKSPVGATYECDGQNFSSTFDLFPQSTYYSMSLGVSQASIRTNNFTYATQYDQSVVLPFYPDITCPPPLVIPDSQDGAENGRVAKTSCALPCPSMLFTEGDYQAVSTTVLVITTISLICAIFLVGSYMFFKEIRQGNYFLQFLFCLILICGAFAIGVYTRYSPHKSVQAHYCVSNTEIASQTQNAGCTVQAFIIVFALLAVSAFFASSGFDLFLRVVLQVEVRPHTQQDYLLNLAYFFWGWTIPLLLTTIGAATESLGPADLGMFYCFVHGRKNATVPWAVCYLPLMVQLFIGCVSLSTTIYQLVRVAKRQQEEEFERQNRDYNYRSNAAPTLRLGNYIVPLMLELVFFLYLGWIVLFRAVVYFLEPSWKRNTEEFASCLLITKPVQQYFNDLIPDNQAEPVDCGKRPKTITLPTWWIHQVFLASLGIVTFCVLGSQRIYYQLWAAVLGYYLNIPSLLVWAATTQQAKIYGKRLARARRARARKLRLKGHTEELLRENAVEGAEIVQQIKEQDKLVKERLRAEQEEKQKKERERQEQLKQQNLNMIAPHLRPLYMVQQRPRRVLPSLIDAANNPEVQIGPKPTNIPDIFVVFNVQADSSTRPTAAASSQQQRGDWDTFSPFG